MSMPQELSAGPASAAHAPNYSVIFQPLFADISLAENLGLGKMTQSVKAVAV